MSHNIQVSLSDHIYQRIKRRADARRRTVGETIAETMIDVFTSKHRGPKSSTDPAIERERRAYLELYPRLRAAYLGHYVAILNAKLIDHDVEYAALFERIDDQYPHEFVWMARVEDEPDKTLVMRSPRFADSV